jgi:hypothetical protein
MNHPTDEEVDEAINTVAHNIIRWRTCAAELSIENSLLRGQQEKLLAACKRFVPIFDKYITDNENARSESEVPSMNDYDLDEIRAAIADVEGRQ